jgi:RNA polymerase-binding transcription factor DksA
MHPDLDEQTLKELRSKLKGELELITRELKSVGRINPTNPADWEATPQKLDIQEADRNEAADRIEGYEENTAILKELETRYNSIKQALGQMDEGTYGICEIGKEPIRIDRLRANPAAKTCPKHMGTDE